ncbi:MAG: hypothetical protein H5T70_01425 [Chloroflexi bacterium]|nr:hypothetical protein [Chloroflexota bacterium]
MIFWIDLGILLIIALLVLMGQWDYVIALGIGLIILNLTDRLQNRRRRS